jgi:sugar phosphate permease
MPKALTDEMVVHQGRYQVLALLCISAAIAYVQRAALSVPASEIAGDLEFANLARDMGWIQSAWYFSYGLMQIPSGWLADRLGSRRALAIFSVVWSLATLLTAFVTDFVSLLVMWSLMGAAQAGAFPCAAKALGRIFPETERARATGLLASGMTLGGAIAPVMTAMILQSLTVGPTLGASTAGGYCSGPMRFQGSYGLECFWVWSRCESYPLGLSPRLLIPRWLSFRSIGRGCCGVGPWGCFAPNSFSEPPAWFFL